MKIKILLIIAVVCCCSYISAQIKPFNYKAEETVRLTISSASVQEWFKFIESKNVILSYNSALIDLTKRVSIPNKEMSIIDLLKAILNEYKLRIIQIEKNKLILQVDGKKDMIISGRIREKETGEKLYGAMIMFRNAQSKPHFTSTNDNGIFLMKLQPGTYTLEVQYMGYEHYSQTINVKENAFLNIDLTAIIYKLKEVTVNPRKGYAELNEVTPSNMLSFNKSDIFAQINILPGVTGTTSNGSFQVNGGGDDENLVLLDGVPFYHTNHLNPRLSAFNGDAIKSVTFHRSFFPPEYEGRLSSVTDIKFKEGNKQKHSQTFTLDTPAASAVLEGPLIKNKLSYMIGARRSWMEIFDHWATDERKLNHSFYDVNAKLSYDINEKSSVELLAYKTSDAYRYPQEYDTVKDVLKWDNQIYSLRFNTIWGKKLFNTNTVTYSSYNNRAYAPALGYTERKFIKSGVNLAAFSSDFSYKLYNIYSMSMGVKLSNEFFDIAQSVDTLIEIRKHITQLSCYYDNKIRITDKLYTQFGINFVSYFPYHDKHLYSIQPRFSLKYSPNESNMLYLGISKMEQFYHFLRMDIVPLPTDFRMPSIKGFLPSTSEHFELGWKHILKNGYVESSTFYKHRNNIMSLRPEVVENEDSWHKYIMTGKGESYGIKFFLYNDWQKFTLQCAYAYSRSKEWFTDMKSMGKLPSLNDIPHVGNLAMTYKITHHTGFTLGAFLQSGRIRETNDDYIYYTDDDFRAIRRKTNYRIDAAYNYIKAYKDSDRKLMFRIGLYNIIGNPTEEDYINLYSINIGKHCLPFGSISIKF